MDFFTRPLYSPKELKTKLPLAPNIKEFIDKSRQEARLICDSESSKTALILGPCSIHDLSSAVEYAKNCVSLQKEVSENFFIIMRVYCEKPRSSIGWKGFIYDPYLDESNNIEEGITLTRELLIKLAELNIPCATEFLDPLIAPYIDDLITWGFIGARTANSQIHRQLISKYSFPIGVKNTLDGDLLPCIKAALFANHPQSFPSINDEGQLCMAQTNGNPYVHPVLRGSNHQSNYDVKSIDNASKLLEKYHTPKRLIVDCSHGNSQKIFTKQRDVFFDLIEQKRAGQDIMGIMVESHINEGSQSLSESNLQYGISITDPCICWKKTYTMIKEGSSLLESITK